MDYSHGTRILPHLYRVGWWDVAKDIVNCDVFAVDCGEAVVLIDAGRGERSYVPLKANLQHWGLQGRVKACLITHMHSDHIGGIPQLRADGVSIWAGRGAAAYSGNAKAVAYLGEVPTFDRVLADGESFTVGDVRFEMLDTPGHTGTCVSYFATIDSVRCAFTGDLLMPNGTIGWSGTFDFDAVKLLASLRRVAERDFDALFTGHLVGQSQPEGFWLHDGKTHVQETIQAGIDGKWVIVEKG